MKLSFVLQQARTGELASLSERDKSDEVVVGYINLALIALHGRFQLITEEAIVTLRPDIAKTVYTLSSGDSDVTVAGQPMNDDEFMSIISAFNEDGSEIIINDTEDPFSILTVSYNQIQVPLLEKNSYISIIYRKNPTLVTYVDNGSGKAVDTDVKLPMQLLEPLLHYIGYRAHGAVNGAINTEYNTHYMRYEAACRRAEELGVITADDTVYKSVQVKGFV